MLAKGCGDTKHAPIGQVPSAVEKRYSSVQITDASIVPQLVAQGLWIELPFGNTYSSIQSVIAFFRCFNERAQAMLALRRLSGWLGPGTPAQMKQNGHTLPSRNHTMRIGEHGSIAEPLGASHQADTSAN